MARGSGLGGGAISLLLILVLAVASLWIGLSGAAHDDGGRRVNVAIGREAGAEPLPESRPFLVEAGKGEGGRVRQATQSSGVRVSGGSPSGGWGPPSESASAGWLEVRTTAASSPGAEPSIAPHVRFQLIGRSAGSVRVPLLSGLTDEGGSFWVKLDGLGIEGLASGGIRAFNGRVTEPGFLQSESRVKRSGGKPGGWLLELSLESGCTVAGIVLDGKGKGAVATVYLCQYAAGEGGGELLPRQVTRSGLRGRFKCDVSRPGLYSLVAVAKDGGVGVMNNIECGGGVQPEGYVLSLNEGAGFSGVVADVQGRPVRRAKIIAVLGAASLQARGGSLDTLMATEFLLREGVMPAGLSTTDSDGSFVIGGLCRGVYHVRAQLEGSRLGESVDLRPGSVLADGGEHVFVVERTLLLIEVEDGEGGQIGIGERGYSVSARGVDTAGEWPDSPIPIVVPCVKRSGGWRSAGDNLAGWAAGGGRVGFDVSPGGTYLVGVVGGRSAPVLELVTVPLVGGDVNVTVRASDGKGEFSTGKIVVRIKVGGREHSGAVGVSAEAPGDSVAGSLWPGLGNPDRNPNDLLLVLRCGDTGAVLLRRAWGAMLPFTFEAPVGSYEVSAYMWPSGAPQGAIGGLEGIRGASQSVGLDSGEREEVVIELD